MLPSFLHPAELSQLLSWFACTELLKAAAIIFIYRNRVFPVFFKSFDHIYFVLAFSFFLLYFTGMLASKIDLICVTSFFSKEEIARYQVLMSLLQATQLSIPILLIPYLAIIYRLPVASIRKWRSAFYCRYADSSHCGFRYVSIARMDLPFSV